MTVLVLSLLGLAATYAAGSTLGWAFGLAVYALCGVLLADGSAWGVKRQKGERLAPRVWVMILLIWPLVAVGAALKGRR